MQNWMRSAMLAGAVTFGLGPAIARAQTEPAPGTRADRQEDRQELRQLRKKIRLDQERLRADIQ
jgi:hypothetical protein